MYHITIYCYFIQFFLQFQQDPIMNCLFRYNKVYDFCERLPFIFFELKALFRILAHALYYIVYRKGKVYENFAVT